MPRYALLIAYDGTDLNGWWRQPDARTVAGELDAACARIGENHGIEHGVVGASRTDAGVHALGQVAHLDTKRVWDADDLAHVLERQLPPDIAIHKIAQVADDFHACHSCTHKTYRYQIDTSTPRLPHAVRQAWRSPELQAPELLYAAAELLTGTHDWQAFARSSDKRDDFVRAIHAITWQQENNGWTCAITGSGFIYRHVRILVGTMVAAAAGQLSLEDISAALSGTRNKVAKQQAPAAGLCLMRCTYPNDIFTNA